MKDMKYWNGHIIHTIMTCKLVFFARSLIPDTSAAMRYIICIITEK